MLRFGVIGAGNIANTFSKAMKATSGKLYAIASRDIDKAKAYQDLYGYEVAYGSYEALCKDPLVDCIYIATPHGLHYEHMKLAISHGKHVLCEKSFTLNEKQAQEIFFLANEQNVFVMEAMWTRFLPTIKSVKTKISEGIIGKVEKIEVSFGFNVGERRKNRLFDPKMGGGALLDIGVYTITLAHLILGIPDSIKSKAEIVEHQYDVSHDILFTYEQATAHLSSSLKEDLPNEAIIYGSKGYIKIEKFWMAEKAFIYNNNHELLKSIYIPHLINGFEYEIQEVINKIHADEQESETMPWKTTTAIMHIMDDLRNSWNLKFPSE
jgi:predicted dehydrogenase